MFYVIFMKPVSHLKAISLSLDIIMLCGVGILAQIPGWGHFQFRDFQLNKIIGFFFSLLLLPRWCGSRWKSFTRKHLFSVITHIYLAPARPSNGENFLHIAQTICSKPAGNGTGKKIMIKF